ncbi:MAG: sensor histidine kinase [Oscillospiraceae bacterium]|nr:sensor histidine kinase [Oscillospiraceae bacterium]
MFHLNALLYTIAALAALLIYLRFFIVSLRFLGISVYETGAYHKSATAVAGLFDVLILAACMRLFHPPFLFLIAFLLIFVECAILYNGSLLVAYWMALGMVFSLSVTRGVAASLVSLAYNQSLYVAAHTDNLRLITNLTAGLLLSAFITVTKRYKFSAKHLMTLISCRSQFRTACVVQTFCTLYMFLLSMGYLFDISLVWLTVFQLISSCLIVFLQHIQVTNTMRFSVRTEEKLRAQVVQTQLARQLSHYGSYQKHVESFRTFKRNYNTTTGNLRERILRHDYVGAIALLDEADTHMQALSHSHKEYSNHALLDAIFGECAAGAAANGIAFSAAVFVPQGVHVSDLDHCRIFSNLCTNALEACMQQSPDAVREIRFHSHSGSEYFTIVAENTFSGVVAFQNNLPITQKDDKAEHGLGLSIVDSLTQANGGFVHIKAEDGIFKVRVHLPISM